MINQTNARRILSASLLLGVVLFGCGRKQAVPTSQQETVDRVRSEVAKILGKEVGQIEIGKPLVALGADELDVVEIIMAIEDAFKVEIPDSAIGEKPDDISKALTVQKLAEIVSQRLR